MISIARTFGAPETVPAGKAGDQRVERVLLAVELAHDVGDDVHHVAVVLEEELVGDLDAAERRDAADVVAAEVEQHQVLGAFLGVGEQLVAERLSSSGVAPRGRVPAIGRIVTSPSRTRTRISGLEPTTAKPARSRK